jgi:phage tail sheath protein FI
VLVSDPYVFDQIAPVNLTGGADASYCTDGECISAINTLAANNRPLTVIIDGGRTTVNYQSALITLAESRMDCVAILSTAFSDEDSSNYLNNVVNYRLYTLNANSSYAALYSSHVWIYDIYNDRNLYVSPDGFIAGLISTTASNYALWWPVAGFRRGIMNVIDVRRRWTAGEMDYLYDNGINPIRFAPGRGIVVWGQKTLYNAPSVLNRLNVRLLAIAIEPAIKVTLEDFLFEFNDPITRSNIVTLINTYMDGVQAGRGVTSYYTVCDSTNNSASDIQNNILNVSLFIVPNESTETINFTLVLTPNSMTFSMAQALT